MEQKKQFLRFLQQRKVLTALALFTLSATILLVWWRQTKGRDINASVEAQKGLNLVLPDADLKEDTQLDKMSYYDKAALDSAKRNEQMKNDPYYNQLTTTEDEKFIDTGKSVKRFQYKRSNGMLNTSPYNRHTYADPNEEKVYSKLQQLNTALTKATAAPETKAAGNLSSSRIDNAAVNKPDVDRLEKMMHTMNQKEGDDPEMEQMNGMLEKILDIQHPDRVQEKIRQTSEERKGQVFAVSAKGDNNQVYLLDNSSANKRNNDSNIRLSVTPNSFNYLNKEQTLDDSNNAVEAVIHETQTLVNGSVVKLRMTNDIYINGVLIPKNNFLFGTASLNDERLRIKINTIRFKNSLFPVELSIFDMDGMEGIYIPGAISRDIAKQTPDMALQNIGFTSLNPSVGAQAATAGIEAAKSFVSKKVKLVKVTVKAGYQVLLRDEKQKVGN